MTDALLHKFGVFSIQPYKKREMESPNGIAVQCNLDWTKDVLYGIYVWGGVGPTGGAGPAVRRPFVASGLGSPLSVISSSASRAACWALRPCVEGWATLRGLYDDAYPTRASTTILLPAPTLSPPSSTRNITWNDSHYFKLVRNGNNMQSVKFNIVLVYNVKDYAIKGIYKDICLLSNVSVILCVPLSIKYTCYSNIITVTEPMQRNDPSADTAVDTNYFGAYKRVDSKNQSQSYIKILDDSFYSIVINYYCILINQMIGIMPSVCIPLKLNAITVQGNSYGNPQQSSFNFKSKISAEAPYCTNKSDYAFKTSTCIIIHELASQYSKLERIEKSNTMKQCDFINIGDFQNQQSFKLGDMFVIISNMKNKKASKIDNNTFCYKPYVPNIKKNEINLERMTPEMSVTGRVENETFANGQLTLRAMIKAVENQYSKLKQIASSERCTMNSWGIPNVMRLCGGGETSLNNATGWGSPPSSNNNGAAGNWGNSSNAQSNSSTNPQQQWNSSAQRPPTSQADVNSNKNGANQASATGNMPVTTSASSQSWQSAPPNITPQQSNTNVQLPVNNGSPNTSTSGGGNNSPGNGSNGNISAANVGSNGSNVPNNVSSSAKNQLEQLSSMREALFSQDGWGGQHVNQDTNWDVPGSPEPGAKMDHTPGGPPAWKPNINNGTDLWEANLRNGGQPPPQPVAKTPWGHTPTTNIGGTWGEDDDAAESSNVWNGPPQQQAWGPPQQPPPWPAKKDDWGAWGEQTRPDVPRDMRPPLPDHRDVRMLGLDTRPDMRGDPRGISGRLNGSNDMWPHQPHAAPVPKMMPGAAGNGQWPAQGPKDMVPSPPSTRRSFEDGASVWTSGQRGAVGVNAWKDGGMGRGGVQCPPGMPPNRLPGGAPAAVKPDGMWGHPQRNGSWEDGAAHPGAWEKDSWHDAPANQGGGWTGPKPKLMGAPGGGSWDADPGDWGGPKASSAGPPGKLLPKDMVWNSKQFRMLVDMGYKKEDAELALRSRDMNGEEALELLAGVRGGGVEAWRRDDARPHPTYSHAPPTQPFPQAQPGLAMSPAIVQKILSQPSPQPPPPFNQPNNQSSGSSQPSTAQLRMLVQQIQMAVSAGYLNHQILNQPLAPQTLVLLNQLLQQIKALQQLINQHSIGMSKGNSSAVLQYSSVQITKTKQQITNLQNQIAAQQAIYVKQQVGGGELFKQSQPDPLVQLQNNFSDMALNKDSPSAYGSAAGQQSRLNQWKLPSLDKDSDPTSEFSRAPGTTSKTTTSPLLNPLALQPDNTWSTGGRGVSDGWPTGEVGADLPDGKEWPSSQPTSAPAAYTDLVPEFEPGKPWKMKNIEDDPAMTPGSVVRSPLSLAAIKDTDLFAAGKSSPTGPSERSLSSSTWSYPPPPASTPQQTFKPQSSKSTWGDAPTVAPDLWCKSRGPPPGLPGSKATPSWGGLSQQQRPNSFTQASTWQSTWLLLKNLTAQIDGSTLKTLCMQHGPLQSFHLYLNQGIALARYSTREEANKAQTALNNCVLGNTTIFAESPSDSDVQMILQHLGQGGAAGGGGWRGGKEAWGYGALWPDAPPDQRTTPSSLNSFLPPDLLGGESM